MGFGGRCKLFVFGTCHHGVMLSIREDLLRCEDVSTPRYRDERLAIAKGASVVGREHKSMIDSRRGCSELLHNALLSLTCLHLGVRDHRE